MRNWWVNSICLFQLQGGVGYGVQQHRSYSTGSSSFEWYRVYLQPAFKLTGKHVDLAISTRFGQAGFGSGVYGLDVPNEGIQPLSEKLANRRLLIMEPALTFGFGYKNLRANLQGGFAVYNRSFPAGHLYFGIGITARLPYKL